MENLDKFWQILVLYCLHKTPVTLEPACGILGKLAEAGQGWNSLTETALLELFIAQLREENKISHCLSSQNSDFYVFGFEKPIGCWSFFPRDHYCLLVCLICPENLTWKPSGWGAPKYGQREMWVAPHLQQESYNVFQHSWELSKSFCLLANFESGSGSWEGNIIWTFSEDIPGSLGLFNTARNIYCLSWLKMDKIFERNFLK